ncbi:hypothetical protein [Companilactobacillus metriopterae]|uniref:hypothetical protein n=1 Tax=Companilactobacillus metriopterae TaxID=1909267 RepID=UPI00100BC10F|nr:hypothetical protein [Companilactobacillus metriopterae]
MYIDTKLGTYNHLVKQFDQGDLLLKPYNNDDKTDYLLLKESKSVSEFKNLLGDLNFNSEIYFFTYLDLDEKQSELFLFSIEKRARELEKINFSLYQDSNNSNKFLLINYSDNDKNIIDNENKINNSIKNLLAGSAKKSFGTFTKIYKK